MLNIETNLLDRDKNDIMHASFNIASSKLKEMVHIYPIQDFLYTKDILISMYANSTSHPKLTININIFNNNDILLSVFLHEQFHWFVCKKQNELRQAVSYFMQEFPLLANLEYPLVDKTPIQTYIHVVICFLECYFTQKFIGKKRTLAVVKAVNSYTMIYKYIFTYHKKILSIIKIFNLLPEHKSL